MNPKTITGVIFRMGVLGIALAALLVGAELRAQTAEDFQQLKNAVEQMRKTIEAQNARIIELERSKQQTTSSGTPSLTVSTHTNVYEAASPSIQALEKVAEGGQIGHQSEVTYRGALNDQQEAASRPKDYTLDPKYQGFIPIPNTPALIKFNAKPHLDLIFDNENSGNKNRFAPALFPLQGDANHGGGEQANVTANASQLRLDVRAPELGGDFRFYYQNDFTGDDTKQMKYRLQHLYGQFYGFKGGFTYSVWEDPDVWPDTVDYEGPNAAVFARRAVGQYTYAWNEHWNTTLGVEKPDIFVDLDSGPHAGGTTLTRIPDLGFNTRYEKAGLGHVQLSTLFRDVGAKDSAGQDFHTFGWGVNLGVGLDICQRDSVQLLGVYGEGVGGLGNDSGFYNSDAAFESNGNLKALPYWSGMVGYTHKWNDKFRSTISYGYDNVDTTSGQSANFYHYTHYASANVIWQIRKRLSLGLEVLYGFKQVQSGEDSGDHWRVQLGMVYSLFD
jgi:hypothetical protein